MSGGDTGAFLDLVYGAAVQPDLWGTAMETLADLIGGTSSFLSQLDVVSGKGTGLIARIDPAMPELYLEHFADKNVLSNVADPYEYIRGWAPRILTDEDWIAKEMLIRSQYYNEFLKPQDIHSVLMIRLSLRNTTISALNIHRGRASEQFAGRDMAIMRRLHPHLIRAFSMSERLAADRRMDQDAALLFEESTHALFLVDESARPLRVNRAGEAFLAAGLGLAVMGGELRACTTAMAGRLEGLIRAAATAEVEFRTGGSMTLQVSEGHAARLISVSPLAARRPLFLAASARALVCVSDPDDQFAFPEERLRTLFGLTPGEIRVASALFAGANAKEAAAKLGVSLNTIHVHIARIFEKTGARRQSDLMAIMMRGGARAPGVQRDYGL